MAGFRDVVGRVLQAGLDLLGKSSGGDGRSGTATAPRPGPKGTGVRTAATGERARQISYAPDLDGAADPGEIVWTWVPFEEDATQGKDRPVLVVARGEGEELLGLMLSSQDRRADDPEWVGIGSGAWDGQGRDSYVRLDRVLEVPEQGIRREGAIVPRDRFDRVADRLRREHGWS
jgi:mRNA-degrading endonuclease toxin of MazEF toxin-antitoxin module